MDYEPLSRTFLDVGNAIRANDYRLARIDVSRPHFLSSHDLPPVDHPIPQKKPQILPSLGPAKLLTQWSLRRKLRLGGFYYFLYVFCCFVCCFFLKKCTTPFLLSMKTFFFCFIRHDICFKIHCQSMATFCHFNLNKIYYYIL